MTDARSVHRDGEVSVSRNKVFLCGLTSVVRIFFAAGSSTQDTEKQFRPLMVIQAQMAEKVKTGKERLSDKASDDQRIDNCKVPLDRRGSKIRPEECSRDDARAVLTR
jgi:hypothetical protein